MARQSSIKKTPHGVPSGQSEKFNTLDTNVRHERSASTTRGRSHEEYNRKK